METETNTTACSFALGRGAYCLLPDGHTEPHQPRQERPTYKRCQRSLDLRVHDTHTWTQDGTAVLCMGISNDREQDRGRCCGDPLCPCAYKPGWGPYAAEGKVQR